MRAHAHAEKRRWRAALHDTGACVLCAVLVGCATAKPEAVDDWNGDAAVPTGHTWETHAQVTNDYGALPAWAWDVLDGENPEDYRTKYGN